MTADEIRALYVETLARSQFEHRTRSYMPREAWVWESRHRVDQDLYRRWAEGHVDALAEAGLLPTGIEWGAGEVEDHTTDRVRTVPHSVYDNEADAVADAVANMDPLMQRYTHDWRVTE